MPSHDILIVEDDPRLGAVLACALAQRGHQIRLATSVAEVRRALAAARPDVLLLRQPRLPACHMRDEP